ncbi:MAG: hypothetical protein COS35_07400 [Zetaproteobacteria bacterium CG02_land_8_20_14_3_00_50_9]|nr:MAG: hypothetical protein COS35_07400 [Zetaproteobacteria bacterium CG02_land_8_20_14_3_00_50_9]
MKFASRFSIQCLAHRYDEAPHAAGDVPHDCGIAVCECGRELDLAHFRAANRAAIIGYELAENVSVDGFAFGFAYMSGDDPYLPAQMIYDRIGNMFDLDLRIDSIEARWQGHHKIYLESRQPIAIKEDRWLMGDVFTHPSLPACGGESPALGHLAPLVAAINMWNTACAMARYHDWLVLPRFDNPEIWHGKPGDE